MTDLHALIHRMADELDHYRQLLADNRTELHPLATEARAALAQPEPEGPTLDDIYELCEEHEFMLADGTSEEESAYVLWEIARAVLARWGRPTPQTIPVSERLPGPEDCDAEGRVWAHMPDMGTAPSWRLIDPREIGPYQTHWLPAHALPVPAGVKE